MFCAMSSAPVRRQVHTRSIRIDAFARDDGLWDIEATLTDTKQKDFELASGTRKAGDPVHRMTLRVTIDTRLNIVDAAVESPWVPYPGYCDTIAPAYEKLIGLSLVHDFRRRVRERLGGINGCTHVTELADVLPTAAIQALAGEGVDPASAARASVAPTERKPFQLDRCHAMATTAPAVAKFYPRWYRGADTSIESKTNG
jgi:hypothetical protein